MDFYKRMATVLNCVPEGKVVTYGQTAALCGKPRNARQVGFALRNGVAGNVPAHRVVNSKGILSGASHFITWDMQMVLLQNEGITPLMTKVGWMVDLERYGWKVSAEELDELNRIFKAEGI